MTTQQNASHVDIWQGELTNVAASPMHISTVLSEAERERATHFKNAIAQQRYYQSKILTRILLAEYTQQSAHELCFELNPYGKPRLIVNDQTEALSFNISHTGNYFALAITRNGEIGIDVEYLNRPVDLNIARRFFTAQENATLQSLDPQQQAHYFLQLWTCKEAILKAHGRGLHYGLNKFGIDFSDNMTIAKIRCDTDHELAAYSIWPFVFSQGKVVAGLSTSRIIDKLHLHDLPTPPVY